MGCFPSNRNKQFSIKDNNTNNTGLKPIKREISLKINSSLFVKEVKDNPFSVYEIIQKLGEGGYGKVYKVINKYTKTIRAMKIINKYRDKTQLDLYEDIEIENLKIKIDKKKYEDERFFKEIEILKRLDHPNIMNIYEFYNREHRFYLICEYIIGEELFEKITKSKHFSEEQACKVMHQIFSGVNYCHKEGITHRDLKPENILIEEEGSNFNIKLIDFGTSATVQVNEKLTKKTGTSFYIAPEVLLGKYNEKCDVWSCGVIMYILLCGGPPFNGSTNNDIFFSILEDQLIFKGAVWNQVSQEAINLIKQLLNKKPDDRITANEALKSKWFKTHKIDNSIIILHNNHLNILGESAEKDEAENNQRDQRENILNIIDNLKTFRAEKKLQQAVLSFIVHELNSNKEIQFIKRIFRSIDKDYDGKLSKEEIKNFFVKNIEADIEIDSIFEKMDADNSGMIEFQEFLIASINKNKIMTEKNLKSAFNRFDFDGNGKIDTKEIKKVFQNLNGSVNEEVWAKLVCSIDIDGDGEIDFNEFKAMMMDKF